MPKLFCFYFLNCQFSGKGVFSFIQGLYMFCGCFCSPFFPLPFPSLFLKREMQKSLLWCQEWPGYGLTETHKRSDLEFIVFSGLLRMWQREMSLTDSGITSPFRSRIASLLRNLGVRKEVREKKGGWARCLIYCQSQQINNCFYFPLLLYHFEKLNNVREQFFCSVVLF